MKKRYPNKNNILLVNITRLGDMLQATPTIAGMKEENPDCKITVLVEKQFESICHWLPNIDETISIDMAMIVRYLTLGGERVIDAYEYVSNFIDDLKDRGFDYCLNMSSSGYTALLLRLVDVKQHGGWTADEEGHRIIESEWAKLFASSVFHQNRQFNSLNLVDVFRSSADVEKHPNRLLMTVKEDAREYVRKLIDEHGFTNEGPLIALQAGASQGKRQWAPENFIRLINILTEKYNARVVLSGTKKELSIIEPIQAGCEGKQNVAIAAGRTNIPQVAALIEMSEVLVTGDTGPMHISVAVGTPVVAMFLASAFAYETGPYSEGNIILQPVIVCGPCNPNKACSRPDCHDCIDPELVAELAAMRIKGEITSLPEGMADPARVIVYRSVFDKFGYCDLQSLNSSKFDRWKRYRAAYRKVWLEDVGGYQPDFSGTTGEGQEYRVRGADELKGYARQGAALIDRLVMLIRDPGAAGEQLGEVNGSLTALDREIEQLGFHFAPLGPVSRMFIFAKENITGTDPLILASQMREHYVTLEKRCNLLSKYYAEC